MKKRFKCFYKYLMAASLGLSLVLSSVYVSAPAEIIEIETPGEPSEADRENSEDILEKPTQETEENLPVPTDNPEELSEGTTEDSVENPTETPEDIIKVPEEIDEEPTETPESLEDESLLLLLESAEAVSSPTPSETPELLENLEDEETEIESEDNMPEGLEDTNHKITYHLNGGENAPENPDYYDENTELTFENPLKKGYTFEGWFADSGCTKLLTSTKGCKRDLNLYAKWSITNYSITYVNDGATISVSEPSFYNINTRAFTYKIPQKSGYTFEGWYTTSDFTPGTKVDRFIPGEALDITLYAKWKEYTYSIKYMPNGGKGDVKISSGLEYSKYYYLSSNPYTRDGYTFTGWSTKPSKNTRGAEFYEARSFVTKLVTANKGTYVLYAQWDINTYNITYNLNGRPDTPAENNVYNPATFTINNSVILRNPTREGFTFEGWYTSSDFRDDTKITRFAKRNSDITVYAKWKENSYKVSYNINGGSFASGRGPATETKSYTGIIKLLDDKAVLERPGYTFEGWSTTPGNKGKLYAAGSEISKITGKNNAIVTLYARWKLIDYNINYVLNGGVQPLDSKGNSKNPATIRCNELKNLLSPTKKGFTFTGWYTSADLNPKSKVARVIRGTLEDITLYAGWKENIYYIAYNANRGIFKKNMKPANVKCNYTDKTVIISGDCFNEKPGYVFGGWNTRIDGKGITYTPGTVVSGLRDVNNSTITLYAIWLPAK